MVEGRPVTVPLSKSKLGRIILGSMAFVALGAWMAFWSPQDMPYSPAYIRVVGAAALLFFGLCGAYAIAKLFDTKPGLILGRDGITDNTSALRLGPIAWNDILDIRVSSVSRQRFLTLRVRDPEQYLRKTGPFRRLLLAKSAEMTGSPINISASALQITLPELENLVRGCWTVYRTNMRRAEAPVANLPPPP